LVLLHHLNQASKPSLAGHCCGPFAGAAPALAAAEVLPEVLHFAPSRHRRLLLLLLLLLLLHNQMWLLHLVLWVLQVPAVQMT
jgi:hypothetical protein